MAIENVAYFKGPDKSFFRNVEEIVSFLKETTTMNKIEFGKTAFLFVAYIENFSDGL